MGYPQDDGWHVLTLTTGRILAGFVRLHTTDDLGRLEIDVPSVNGHTGLLAIISPEQVASFVPCTEEQAKNATRSLWPRVLGHAIDPSGEPLEPR